MGFRGRAPSPFGVGLCLALALAVGVGHAPQAFAQSRGGDVEPSKKKSAKAAYEDGERAFNKGDYRKSGESFENAYRLLPHHSALWAAARAWLKAGEEVRAANLLERYLGEAPADSPDRDRATEVVRQLDKKLGRLDVVRSDVENLRIDGAALSLPRLWVVPGEHVATGEIGGKPVRKVISVAAGDHVSVTLEVVSPKEQPPPPPPPPPVSRKPLPPWVAIAGGVLTLAGTGATVYSYTDTLDKKKTFEADRTSRAKLDDAHSAESRTNVFLFTTVGIGAVTVLASLFLVEWNGDEKGKSDSKTGAGPRLTPALGGVAGTF